MNAATPERERRAADVMLERSVAPWRDRYPQVAAWTHLRDEPPREALLDAATGAEMLVVGNRGAGGFGPPALGPVGQAMVDRAPCAVTVTHTLGPSNEEPRRDTRDEEERRRVGVTPFERLRLIRDLNERIVVRPDKLEID